jgi:hypothetical protein
MAYVPFCAVVLTVDRPYRTAKPRIIRECYDYGVLTERTIEGSNVTPWHCLMLVVHTVIAISLAVLAAVAIHDSLTFGSALLKEETSAASCEQPRF